MIESLEFWGILLSLLAGFGSSFVMLYDIRNRVCENAERITKLETETHMEFEKCRLHDSCTAQNRIENYE